MLDIGYWFLYTQTTLGSHRVEVRKCMRFRRLSVSQQGVGFGVLRFGFRILGKTLFVRLNQMKRHLLVEYCQGE